MNLSDMFSKKIGPVPVIYIAAGFVAILGVVAWRMKPAATGDPTPDATVPTPDDPYAGFESTGTVIAAPSSTVTPPPTIDSNDEWVRAAAAYLLSKKLVSAGDALTVMSKYVNGAPLSYEEGALRDAAIMGIGYPPEPLQGTSVVLGHVARKQFDGFPGRHTVTGPADNTLSKIAVLYYGASAPIGVSVLIGDNPTLGTGTLATGAVVTVNALATAIRPTPIPSRPTPTATSSWRRVPTATSTRR